MSYKRLTPCIFIAGGKAVRWFDDRTVLTEDVIALAKQYNANGADELLVFDLSDSDEDHVEFFDLIKRNSVLFEQCCKIRHRSKCYYGNVSFFQL